MLETRELSKTFTLDRRRRLRAVDAISLTIRECEVLGLVGESGSGKSTFGRLLVGLLDKSAGEVLYRGERLPARYRTRDFRHYAREMQLIFQDPYASLDPRMHVEQLVGEPLRLLGERSARHRRDQVAAWLERVGLATDLLSRYPHEFSGGQRQRIGIARALITRPRFLVCDEPLSALDVSIQAQMVNLLGELQQALGLTMLFIAHDLSMVRFISDRMAVMYLGALMEVGPADDVYGAPRHPYTRMLIDANPVPDPVSERARDTQLIRGEIPSAVDLPPGCRFAGRCPHVMPQCRRESPQLIQVAEDHQVACFLY
ncbi:MAG: ATP-binding cassette domain-containing protein [Oceanospirillaceae bacterium]|nr:ATP-binding cassette domain-containing protein [Oceanospirillaceae bacterium]